MLSGRRRVGRYGKATVNSADFSDLRKLIKATHLGAHSVTLVVALLGETRGGGQRGNLDESKQRCKVQMS